MSKKQYVLWGILGAVPLVLALAFGLPGPDGKAGDRVVVARPIPTAPARPLVEDQARSFPGKVRAARRVDLAFPVTGVLARLDAQEGDRVRKGDLLARLDRRDFGHQVDAARAKCDLAGRRLERMRDLLAGAAVTEDDFEEASTAYEVALADLRIKEKALADTVLEAPFDGVVVSRGVENYEHVNAQQTVMSLQDTSLVEVVIQIPERLFAHGGPKGLKNPRVRFDADETHWFDAAVREYNAESDKVTRSYDVVVVLRPPGGIQIYPGMTATVEARVGTESSAGPGGPAVLVPVEAVWRGPGDRAFVWCIDPDGGSPRRVQVRIESLHGGEAVVRGAVEPGVLLAVAGLHALSEGIKARPMKRGKDGLDG